MEGGSTIGEGNVLAYDDVTTEWGAVCADGWDEREADIACRHLGFAGNSGRILIDINIVMKRHSSESSHSEEVNIRQS